MTLAISLTAQDGMVLAADARGTIGDPRGLTAISDVNKKIRRLTRYSGIAMAGSSEIATALLDGMDELLTQNGDEYIDQVLNRIREQFRLKSNEWFSRIPMKERPVVMFVVGGYKRNGGNMAPMTYTLSSQSDYAPMLSATGTAMIGIPQYAIYLANRYYVPQMKVDKVSALAEFLIHETASQDPKVGGPISIARVTEADGYVELTAADVAGLRSANERQTRKLRDFFFKRGTR